MNSKTAVIAALCGSLAWACQGPTPKPAESPLVGASSSPVVPRQEEAPSPLASAPSWSPTDGLGPLLLRAETQSPFVRRAYQAWQAALARVSQVSALPDPWLSLSGYVQSVETRTGPMDGRLGFNQQMPWPGKLETAGNRASAVAESARLQMEQARLQVRRQFLRDWTERIYISQAEQITAAQVDLLQHIEDVSLRLYESARVSQADVLRAQVEKLEMADRLDTLREREAPLEAAMEAALGVSLGDVGDWQSMTLLDEPALPVAEQLQQWLLEASPELAALQARIEASKEAERLAELENYPDFAFGADWTWVGTGNIAQPDSGKDAFAISLAVELPLQRGRIAGAKRQALAEHRQVLEQLQRRQWTLLANLQSALSSHDDAWRRVALFEDQLLPKAEMTYDTTLAAYQSGQAAFQDMLDAARVVLDFRLSTARAQADAALAYADLNGLLPIALLSAQSQDQ